MVGAGAGAVSSIVAPGAGGMTTGQTVLGGLAAGAIIGGTIGAIQEAQDRKEQQELAQLRAYQNELSAQRRQEAQDRLALEEELAIRKGYQITDLELAEAERTAEETQRMLDALREERQSAYNRTKTLEELQQKALENQAEIARLQEELERLKGGQPLSVELVPLSTATPAEK